MIWCLEVISMAQGFCFCLCFFNKHTTIRHLEIYHKPSNHKPQLCFASCSIGDIPIYLLPGTIIKGLVPVLSRSLSLFLHEWPHVILCGIRCLPPSGELLSKAVVSVSVFLLYLILKKSQVKINSLSILFKIFLSQHSTSLNPSNTITSFSTAER